MKAINFPIEEELYNKFKEQVASDACSITQVLKAAIRSYTEQRLIVQGAYLIVTGGTQDVLKKKVGRPPEEHKVEKSPTSVMKKDIVDGVWPVDENGMKIHWIDLDHSKRPLEGFDYPDNIHPAGESRKYLEIDWSINDYSGSLENMIISEFHTYREKFDDRVWHGVEWNNFCRYCAKKFLTLNKANFRYDPDYLETHLYRLKNMLEANYQHIVAGQEEYDRQNPK